MTERNQFSLRLGKQAWPLGELVHFQQGGRVFSQFSHAPAWLQNPKAFAVSPELDLLPGAFIHQPRTTGDASVFHALADTLPGAWSERVIRQAHRTAFGKSPDAPEQGLTDLDRLCAVNDAIRLGALRVFKPSPDNRPCDGPSWWSHAIHTPPLTIDSLPRALAACRAVEFERFLPSDLPLLMAHGTALGGSQPKVTVVDELGHLCVAKFACAQETASVPLAEVLAMKLAERAGIKVAPSCVWRGDGGSHVALIRRFDRERDGRKPYVSAATLLQASRQESLGYLDLLRAMQRHCAQYPQDARQLWRRLVFNLLICNVDDHLQSTGFVYAGNRRWNLAPAFGLRPFPRRERALQIPLSVKSGRIRTVEMLLEHAHAFEHTPDSAHEALAQVQKTIHGWREVASSSEIGMSKRDQKAWAPAFESDLANSVC